MAIQIVFTKNRFREVIYAKDYYQIIPTKLLIIFEKNENEENSRRSVFIRRDVGMRAGDEPCRC